MNIRAGTYRDAVYPQALPGSVPLPRATRDLRLPEVRSSAVILLCGLVTAAAGVAAPAAPAVGWSAARDIPGSVGAGFPFDTDVGPRGTAAVAFVRRGLQVVRRDARGRWHAPERVSRARASVTAPDVEMTGRGEIVVAWTQALNRRALPPSGPNELRVAVRRRSGGWRGRAVGRTRHFIDAGLQLAVDARGDAAVIWRGGSRDVLLAAARRAGHAFRPGRSLGEPGSDQRVAVDAQGRAFAAWTRTIPPQHLTSQIRFATRAPSGAWTRPTTVVSGRVGGPELALAPGEPTVLAWREEELGLGATRTGLPAVAVRSPSGAWSAPRRLSDVRTRGLQLGVSASAEVLATWSPAPPAYPQPGERALYAVARPRGQDFGPVTRTGSVLDGPLAVLADGSAVTVAAGGGIESAVRPPGGVFAPVPRLTRGGDFPSLSAWGAVALAVWAVRGRLRAASFRAG